MYSALLVIALATQPTVSPIDAYPIDGIDIASWQHNNGHGHAINWPQVRDAGIDFATIKATEGSTADDTDYVNPWFDRDLDGARAANLPVAPYHFYLGRTPQTGAAQAEHFVATTRRAGYTGNRPLDLPPILDFEWDWKGGACPAHLTVADVRAWLDHVEAAFNRRPIIYTNRYFISECLGDSPELGGYPLQIAHYADQPPTALPSGWSDWLMWQWIGRDTVPGVPGGEVTRSVLNGTKADLNALAGLSEQTATGSP